MQKEIALRSAYLDNQSQVIESIYLGGGTPSLLNHAELMELMDQVYRYFHVCSSPEITLEANPDDLTHDKLRMLYASPVNRLSIGIQSFSNQDLQFFNRAHNAEEAERCVHLARDAGFEQLTLDLIYGSPTTTDKQWEQNVAKVLGWKVPHLSCYALTVEPRTALAHQITEGKVPPVLEEQSVRQLGLLMDWTYSAGYEHYEISNFALSGSRAVHNSNYWLGIPYLGIGPSAHSFNGKNRSWNISNNALYTRSILENEELPTESEFLTVENQYNEYVMTRLRTTWGCTEEDIRKFGKLLWQHFYRQIQTFLEKGQVLEQEGTYVLTRAGKFMADRIAMECFWVK